MNVDEPDIKPEEDFNLKENNVPVEFQKEHLGAMIEDNFENKTLL